MVRHPILAALILGTLTGGLAVAQTRRDEAARALALAKRQAEEATLRSEQLERRAASATNAAARARDEASALAARIEASEADITAAETRVRMVETLRAQQRARLAVRQEPVVRLTAALQMMGRRPPALALVQPGSLHDLVHVRALLASTLPVIRQRTAALREEVEFGNRLRKDAERAVAALVDSQGELKKRRIQLARFEIQQRQQSANLAASAMAESDRALALGEEARELTTKMGTLEFQARLRQQLTQLPGPSLRPGGAPVIRGDETSRSGPLYRLPVAGRLVTGMGEISDGGVHARGLTFETAANAQVVAPAAGKILYAGRFRDYGSIVIIDHGHGWTSAITDLAALDVAAGDSVSRGTPIGRTGGANANVTVELRHRGQPYPIAPLLAGG